MIERPASAFAPPPALAPGAYPGAAPGRSFLYRSGQVEVTGRDEDFGRIETRLEELGAAPVGDRIAVLCLGSNASPAQIERKLARSGPASALPVALARVVGLRPVFAGHVASYGAVPASAEDSPAGGDLFVGYYTRDQLADIHRSEHGNYDLCALPDLEVEIRSGGTPAHPRPVHAFLSRWGVLCRPDRTAIPLGEMAQLDLVAWLLRRTGLDGELNAAVYLDAAAPHRRRLHDAIGERGLRRPHSITAEVVEPGAARTVRWAS